MQGKTVLITGAATGIGRAIALEVASLGGNLVLGDVVMDELEQTSKEAQKYDTTVIFQKCDVRQQEDIDALFQRASDALGAPDVVYANAGVEGPLGTTEGYSEADFSRVLDINVMGVWRTMKAALPPMLERGSGAIVATASVAGLVGAAGLPAYVSSKHAVIGLVKSTAISVAQSGVRVNAVCPGMVNTPMLDRLITAEPAMREGLLALKPMARLGEPEEIAKAAVWLGSDQASFVTGHTLAVDGGYVAQ